MSEKDLSDEQAQKRIILQRKKAKAWITLLSIVAVIVFILLLVSIWRYYEKYQIAKVGVYAQQLLKEKYNKDFEIKPGSGRYTSEANIYQYGAYPKGKPQFVFNVMLSGPHSKRMVDGYKDQQISMETWLMVKPYVDEISHNYQLVSVGVGTYALGSIKEDEEALAAKYNLPYYLWIKRYSSLLNLSILVYFDFPISAQNKKEIYHETYKLIKFLRDKRFNGIMVNFLFFDFKGKNIKDLYKRYKRGMRHKFKTEYIASLKISSIRMREDLDSPKANEYGFVRYNDLDKIHSPQDIAQFITWFHPKEEVLQQKNKEQSKDKWERVL